MRIASAVLACMFASVALAAPPPAPQVTVAATDIRQLEFNWDPVPGVQRYELWFSSAPGAPWAFHGERDARRSPTFRIAVPVHLLNWAQATYVVKACNSGGCSSSNPVGVDGEKLNAMGFIKPQAATGHFMFGSHVALSADGKTLAVLTGETLGVAEQSLVVHVYRMTTATSGWRREARLLPTYVKARTLQGFEGNNIALSANGDVLVVGSFQEPASRAGVPENAGAVYLFRRDGTTWRTSQKISGQGLEIDRFGLNVELDDAGRTLVIWHQYNNGVWAPGTLEIYRDPVDSSDQFVHQMTLPNPPQVGSEITTCEAIGLSGDGNTLMRGCLRDGGHEGFSWVYTGPNFTHNSQKILYTRYGIDLSYDGKVALIEGDGGAEVYQLTNSGWQFDGLLSHFPGVEIAGLRHSAISRDGKIVAIGNPREYTIGIGPVYPPYVAGDDEFRGTGGVVVHQRKASGWEVRRLIKPGSTNDGWTGWNVELGDNGKIMAVGAPQDPSAATGIDGDRDDDSAPIRGAVWLY